jgi:hypothetical protein
MFKMEQIRTLKSAIKYAEYWKLCCELQHNIMLGGHLIIRGSKP